MNKEIQQRLQIVLRNRFVRRDPNRVVVEKPEIDQALSCLFQDDVPAFAKLHMEGIKTGTISNFVTEFFQCKGQCFGL